MNTKFDTLFQAVENCKDVILAAGRYIWNNPVPGYREWKTHAYMKEKFEGFGYCVNEVGNTPGFWVDIDTGRPGPKLAIFAEMDSLIVPSHPECDPETGAAHSSEYYIADAYSACVLSAKVQVGAVALLLENGAEKAANIVKAAGPYATNGTVTLKYSN